MCNTKWTFEMYQRKKVAKRESKQTDCPGCQTTQHKIQFRFKEKLFKCSNNQGIGQKSY